MGCAESKQEQEPNSQPLLLSNFKDDDDDGDDRNVESILMPPSMGQPQAQTPTGAPQLSTQHERLILELLPFKDARQFHE
jgi:hypothetical protein